MKNLLLDEAALAAAMTEEASIAWAERRLLPLVRWKAIKENLREAIGAYVTARDRYQNDSGCSDEKAQLQIIWRGRELGLPGKAVIDYLRGVQF